jgi:hypothetical protein
MITQIMIKRKYKNYLLTSSQSIAAKIVSLPVAAVTTSVNSFGVEVRPFLSS